jgi:1-phosphatidylinositol-3-phosphate 5-kinase
MYVSATYLLLLLIFLQPITYLRANIVLFFKVRLKWKQLFSEIENGIQDLRSRYTTQAMGEGTNISVYEGLLLEVTRMLVQEKNEVEVIMMQQFYYHLYFLDSLMQMILNCFWVF